MPGLRIRVKPVANVIFKDIDGLGLTLNLDTGQYFDFDPVATRIWTLLHERERLADVLDVLLREYDVTYDQLEADLLHFVAQLQADKLIQVVEDASPLAYVSR